MAKAKKETPIAQAPETLHTKIEQKLSDALSGWKELMGEKKFEKRIRKATEIFGKGLKTPQPKKASTTAKKVTVSKTAKKAASKKKV